jgi:large subunit ribosomal protein L13
VNTLSYKTESLRKEDVQHNWYVIDAEDQVVGRISSKIAHVLRGKHKADYTPHVDNGDCVIVINADKIKFTGDKMRQKEYISYSLHPGGQKRVRAEEMLAKFPERIVEKAVKGMLPKNKLGRAMYKKLFVYKGAEHPHTAQKPEPFKF